MRDIRNEFDNAVYALRGALKAAIDDPTFDRNSLQEMWRHYQGVQTIAEGLPDTSQSAYNFDSSSLYPEEFDYPSPTVQAAQGNVEINTGFGQDVITFS